MWRSALAAKLRISAGDGKKTVKVQKVLRMEFYLNHNCALSNLQRSLGVNPRKWQSKIQRIKHSSDLATSMMDEWFKSFLTKTLEDR